MSGEAFPLSQLITHVLQRGQDKNGDRQHRHDPPDQQLSPQFSETTHFVLLTRSQSQKTLADD